MQLSTHIGRFFGIIFITSLFTTPIAGIGAGAFMGYYPGVMERLKKCPAARRVLGKNIGVSYLGWSCGSAETEGGWGRATWSLPVRGDSDRGSFRFYLEKHGRGWQMKAGTLKVGEREINILRCF